MINLFRGLPTEQGSLTAALLALLEHSDRELLNGLLRRADIPVQVQAGTDVEVQFPAPGGPPAAGTLVTPSSRVTILTQAPGEPGPPAEPGPAGETLAVTLTGKGPAGAHTLSWEQLDRWLAESAERFDPESRTGFLIRQFRAFLPEVGIEYFAGFAADQLEGAPGALEALTRFYQTAGQLFDRLAPALAASPAAEGAAQVRQSRAEDLLGGYCYRDFTGAMFGPGNFLRVALHLPQQELQISFWFMPGGEHHTRLREALTDDALLTGLMELEHPPILWLWSAAGERKLPLDELTPDHLENWAQYQAGLQCALPFDHLAGPGLVGTVLDAAEALLTALEPLLPDVLH